MNKHTQYCIICGKKFDENCKPSKEHIIPEALGNTKLITYNVCTECNNSLGGHVDSYLVSYVLVKIIRSLKLSKDKNIRIFDKKMTDDKERTYRTDGLKLEIAPKVKIDKSSGQAQITTSSVDEGIKIARGILRKTFGKTESEIDAILSDPDKFTHIATRQLQAGTFSINADLDLSRLRLAAIKIAYEFAVEKLGETYTADEYAAVLRAYLKAGRDGKRIFSEKEADDISKRCHCMDSFTKTIADILKPYKEAVNGRSINCIVYLFKNDYNQMLCLIRILDEDLLTFSVLLSENAVDYPIEKSGYIAVVLDDNNLIET